MSKISTAKVSIILSACALIAYISALITYFVSKDDYYGGLAVVIPITIFASFAVANIVVLPLHVLFAAKNKTPFNRLAIICFASIVIIFFIGQVFLGFTRSNENEKALNRPVPTAENPKDSMIKGSVAVINTESVGAGGDIYYTVNTENAKYEIRLMAGSFGCPAAREVKAAEAGSIGVGTLVEARGHMLNQGTLLICEEDEYIRAL